MRSVLIVGLVFASLASGAVASGAVAARSCNSHAANNKIYAAYGMTCSAAARDLLRSISVCCQARFRSHGGFYCTTNTSGVGRCVRNGRSYRFIDYE